MKGDVHNKEILPGSTLPTKLTSVTDGYLRYYADDVSHTARAKRLDIEHLLKFLTKYCGVKTASEIPTSAWSASSLQAFVEHLLKRNEAPATVARRLATVKHMGRILAEQIPGFTNPAREVRPPKSKPLRPKGISEEELKDIRGNLRERINEKPSFTRYRNGVLFALLEETGLRADEIRFLRLAQIDEDLEWIKNVRTKGRRYRNVYIAKELRALLQEYLTERTKQLTQRYGSVPKSIDLKIPVFVSFYKAQLVDPDSFLLGAKSIWRAIRELSCDTKLHPHLLRHTYALELLESSKDVRLVAQALGHSDVRTTMRYTERTEEEIAKAVEEKNRRRG